MTINSATFLSDMTLFIRNTLRSNLTDPLGRTSDNSKYVFTSFPKENTVYPLVTVKTTGITSKKLGMISETSWVDCNIEVRAWSRNSKEIDTVTQTIIDKMRTAQYGTNSTTDEQIFGFTLSSCVPIVEDIGDQNLIHSKVCTFKYSAILG